MLLWGDISAAQRAELRDQIEVAVDRGDLEALASLVASSGAGADALAEAMATVAALGAAEIAAEAGRQGVDGVRPAEPPAEQLGVFAAGVAGLLADALANAAGREALRVARPGRTGAEVADEVEDYLIGLGDRALRDDLGGALWAADGAGRRATLEQAEPAPFYYVANEVRDANSCKPCLDIDGTIFVDLEQAVEQYPNGGYRDCLGRQRCRGRFEPVWAGEIPADLLEQTTPKVPEAARRYHGDLEDIEDLAATRLAVEAADRRGAVEWKKLAGGMSADTELAILPDGRRIVRKKAPPWGDPSDNVAAADAEQLAFFVNRELQVKSPKIYRDEPDAVWMQLVRGKTMGQLVDEGMDGVGRRAFVTTRAGQRMGLADMLTGQRDRNSGNLMRDEAGELVGIDHGGAWLARQLGEAPGPQFGDFYERPIRSYVDDDGFIDNPMHPRDVPEVRRRLEGLRPDFERLGRGDWLDWSLDMLGELTPYARGKTRLYG